MSLLQEIKQILSEENVLEEREEQAYASSDLSTNVAPNWPYLVVRVGSIAELISVAQCCIRHKHPIVMRGAGTGKSGGAIPSDSSVVIDITKLHRILRIDKENLYAEVEPGVILADFQDAVEKEGLFYPPDPASRLTCTLGGNVAENAAGPSTLKYGTTRDYLLGGQAILGTGDVVDFGKRCPKGVAGYDIAALLCGSEGTLAIFTKFVLRLLPLPKSFASAMVYFPDEDQALASVNAILTDGHLPKTLEYIDDICLRALNKLLHINDPSSFKAGLIIECDASFQGGAQLQLDAILAMLKTRSLITEEIAPSEKERRALWHKRSQLSEACSRFLGHKLSEDIAIPLGTIGEFGGWIKGLSPNSQVLCGIFGHAGDGNLHVQIMFDDPKWKNEAQALRHEILLKVLALGGTITAEHGIGLQKKAYLPLEQSTDLIALQKRIKQAFDPFYLLNPGKIFDV